MGLPRRSSNSQAAIWTINRYKKLLNIINAIAPELINDVLGDAKIPSLKKIHSTISVTWLIT